VVRTFKRGTSKEIRCKKTRLSSPLKRFKEQWRETVAIITFEKIQGATEGNSERANLKL